MLENLEKLQGPDDELAPGQKSLIQDLFELFTRHVPERIGNLQTFVDCRDLKSLRSEAHALKSSSGNLGAKRFARLCAEIEQISSWGDDAHARSLVTELTLEYPRVERELRSFLASRGKAA
jgi:HPt (histidine-containing phosphotransfer) domain-containing protein